MPVRGIWKSLRRSGRRAASPAPSATQSMEIQSSQQRRPEHKLKPSPIPSATLSSADAKTTDNHLPEGASQASPPAPPVEPPPNTEQQTPTLSASERLWNSAYDRLETDDAELVGSYVETLEKVLGGEAHEPSSADLSAKLKDPTLRQRHMRELVQRGQEKIPKASQITTGVGEVADFILSAKEMVDLVLQSVPQAAPAALPWAGVCLGLQILRNPAQATKSNLAGIAHVISRMDWYCALTGHLLNENNIAAGNEFQAVLHQLEGRVVELYKALLLYQMKSVCSYYRNQGLVFLRSMLKQDDWDGSLELVTDAEAAVRNDAAQYLQEQTKISLGELVTHAEGMETRLGDIHQDIREFIRLKKEMQLDDKDEKCLQDLFVVDPQDDMERIQQNKDTLLHGGYNWILNTEEYAAFTNWSSDESTLPSCRLVWVKGHAGTGKTMLLMGIIRELSSQPATLAPKVSHFFCQGTDQALNSATATLRSLIWLLLVQQPHLISHLRSKHQKAGPGLFKDQNAFIALSSAFKSILGDRELRPLYFIVDALDECDHGLAALIKLITTSLALSDKVKWLVSSRPTVELKTPDTAGFLVELGAQRLEAPVNAYIDHKLSILKTREGYDDRVLAEIADEVRRRAENTFLWVSLVFKELDAGVEDLNPVHGSYALKIVKEIPSGLSKLYNHMLVKIEKGMRGDPQHCKNALVAIVLAYRPLTLAEFGVLAGLPLNMDPQTVARKCGSFLTVKHKTVYLIHQSAKDYLDENYTSMLQPAGVVQGHADIVGRAISAMSSTLRQNIYHLDFDTESWNITPPNPDPLAPIRYSCIFWARHLCFLGGENPGYLKELTDEGVLGFLEEHLLHWLESLSLLKKVSDGKRSIRKLLHVAQSRPDTSHRVIALLNDAEELVNHYSFIMSDTPLQIYGTALVFSPVTSEVRNQHWKRRLSFIEMTAGTSYLPGTQLHMLEGRSSVTMATFSPDGKILASGSQDCTVRLWDAATGECRQTLEGRSRVTMATFSPDGKILASASQDFTVQLWDAATGECRQTLEGHRGWICAVAFSPDGKILASASEDCTVRLWDATTGTHQKILEGHRDWVGAVDFSPDGKMLASASGDRTIRLWDAATGKCRQTLEGYSNSGRAVALSPDGKILALASYDGTVRLWDTATGECRQTFEGLYIGALSFSENGQYLETSQGPLSITPNSDVPSNSGDREPAGVILIRDRWVTLDEEKLLRLPHAFGLRCMAVHGYTCGLGFDSGVVTFIRFAFTE